MEKNVKVRSSNYSKLTFFNSLALHQMYIKYLLYIRDFDQGHLL